MPSAQAEPVELDLLRSWREPLTSRRVFRDALGSLVVHGVLIIAFFLAPEVELSRNAPVIADDLTRSVKLTLPRSFEPTQTAPNHGKVKRELDDRSAVEGARAQSRRYRPPTLSPGLPQPAAPSMVAEAPHLDLPQIEGPKSVVASLPTPNLPLQAPAPQTSAENPTKRGIPPPPKGAGITVRDPGIDQPSIAGSNQTPAPCQTCSSLQLLSNPQDVDFQPYLLQVLRVVKQNWLTVIPAEARQGRRGNVTVRFVIDKKGAISNLVITAPSGTGAFDLAAATGLSMSNSHFPPLPSGYKGDEIRLQMTFAYNSLQ
jgi:TonB family protein